MDEYKLLHDIVNDNSTIIMVLLLWDCFLTFCIVYLTCFANRSHKKINKMYKHLEFDMEQEEIMNG